MTGPTSEDGVVLDVDHSHVGQHQHLLVAYDVLVHDVHLLGQPPLVHLSHHPRTKSLLLVIVPDHPIWMDVSARPRSAGHLLIDLDNIGNNVSNPTI